MNSVPAAQAGDVLTHQAVFRAPVAAVFDAARYLDAAVSAHLARRFDIAQELLLLADLPSLRQAHGADTFLPESAAGLTAGEKRRLLLRDRYHCRFCGTPVVAPETRDRVKNIYHQIVRWGKFSEQRHAALQVMSAQFHRLDTHTVVVTCTPCHAAEIGCTIEELCLDGAPALGPLRSTWDGLERFR